MSTKLQVKIDEYNGKLLDVGAAETYYASQNLPNGDYLRYKGRKYFILYQNTFAVYAAFKTQKEFFKALDELIEIYNK